MRFHRHDLFLEGERGKKNGNKRKEKGKKTKKGCCRHVVAAVVVVVAIAMSFCRLVVVFTVVLSSRVSRWLSSHRGRLVGGVFSSSRRVRELVLVSRFLSLCRRRKERKKQKVNE